MSACKIPWRKEKYLKSKRICVENLTAVNLSADTINAGSINANTITADLVQSKDVQTDTLEAKNVSISDTLNVKNLAVGGNFYLYQNSVTLEVGADKQFKSPQEAINALRTRVIIADVNIKIYPGEYDGFDVSGFELLNENQLFIVGDGRIIVGQSFVSRPELQYNTFVFTPQGNNTEVQIYNNTFPDTPIDFGSIFQVVAGDKVVFYNDDQSVQQSLRFTQADIVSVSSTGFVVNVNIDLPLLNSAITFLPNVRIRCTQSSQLMLPYLINQNSVITNLYNIYTEVPLTLKGITTLEASQLSMSPSILNAAIGVSSFDNIVSLSLTWVDETINGIHYTGFRNLGGFFSSDLSQLNVFYYTVLGTGFSPQNRPLQAFVVQNSTLKLENLWVIGSVENEVPGASIVKIYKCNGDMGNFNLIGTQADVGASFANSNVELIGFLISDAIVSLEVAENSYINTDKGIVDYFDIGYKVKSLSRAIVTEESFYNGTQDFCIEDGSLVIQDGVLVPPGC